MAMSYARFIEGYVFGGVWRMQYNEVVNNKIVVEKKWTVTDKHYAQYCLYVQAKGRRDTHEEFFLRYYPDGVLIYNRYKAARLLPWRVVYDIENSIDKLFKKVSSDNGTNVYRRVLSTPEQINRAGYTNTEVTGYSFSDFLASTV